MSPHPIGSCGGAWPPAVSGWRRMWNGQRRRPRCPVSRGLVLGGRWHGVLVLQGKREREGGYNIKTGRGILL